MTHKQLEKEGYFNIKKIYKIGACGLFHFAFTTGLVVGIDLLGYNGRYCYEHLADAVEALENWDGVGDPEGNWIKYKGEGGERMNKFYE
jgi:hypothetical protein